MTERNPLQRVFVEPVDIYQQTEEPQNETTNDEPRERVDAKKEVRPPKKKVKAATGDPLRPYSTYLSRSQVKNIKRHAVEREIKDMIIMQEAVDEYLQRHTL